VAFFLEKGVYLAKCFLAKPNPARLAAGHLALLLCALLCETETKTKRMQSPSLFVLIALFGGCLAIGGGGFEGTLFVTCGNNDPHNISVVTAIDMYSATSVGTADISVYDVSANTMSMSADQGTLLVGSNSFDDDAFVSVFSYNATSITKVRQCLIPGAGIFGGINVRKIDLFGRRSNLTELWN
jgi:hypothetical protein